MFFHGFLMKPQTQSTKTKSYVLQLFFVLPALQKKQRTKTEQPKNQETKSKKKTGKTRLHPPKGGDEDAERPPLALDPLLEVCWLPPMGQGVQGLDFWSFFGT